MMREIPASQNGGGGGKYLRDSASGSHSGDFVDFGATADRKSSSAPKQAKRCERSEAGFFRKSTKSPTSNTANPRILEEESQASHSSLRDTAPAVARQSISPDLESSIDCHEKSSDFSRNDSIAVDYHDLPNKARDDSKNTLDSISIIIPCFNEKSTIADILQAVQSVPIPYHKEIIIVDDCSTDGTREILATLQPSQENCSLKILYHDKNQGKGASLRTGITHASGDIVLIQDADLEYDPNEYPKLLAPFEKGVADVVFGSRFVSGESHRVLYFWHRMGNGLLTLLSNMMTNLNLTDMETCYKVFKREIIQSITIEENRFGFEPEITAKIAKIKGIRIYEVGISYYGRTYEEGKKIGVKDGFRALWAIVKYRFKG